MTIQADVQAASQADDVTTPHENVPFPALQATFPTGQRWHNRPLPGVLHAGNHTGQRTSCETSCVHVLFPPFFRFNFGAIPQSAPAHTPVDEFHGVVDDVVNGAVNEQVGAAPVTARGNTCRHGEMIRGTPFAAVSSAPSRIAHTNAVAQNRAFEQSTEGKEGGRDRMKNIGVHTMKRCRTFSGEKV